MIAILDFGSQYTQLIAKRLREIGFDSFIVSGPGATKDQVLRDHVKGIILSGSPWSVGDGYDPPDEVLEWNIPILGLCFGYQFLAKKLGGVLSPQSEREYGAARVNHTEKGRDDPLVANLSLLSSVWMSHGDSVVKIPPEAELILESHSRPAGFSVPSKKIWALQFHPEVHHTPEGGDLLKNFAQSICGLAADWDLDKVFDDTQKKMRQDLSGVDRVFCAVSGGVDSTVLAALLSQVTTVEAYYVDHGFCRSYDETDLRETFKDFPKINLHVVRAAPTFWSELSGVSDPETKRKIMGRLFIQIFESEIEKDFGKSHKKPMLAQGTIYSDVIESASSGSGPSHKIKSHHNVGGLPDVHNFQIYEPLRNLFKDEVRRLGTHLGISEAFLARHPFPGPGLSIRCLGPLSEERIEILRKADSVFISELKARGLYEKCWQALCVLLPVKSVGVMGDGRSYSETLALRAISSVDAMTAEATELPWHDLKEIASKLVNEVGGISRVVFDLSSKPPATIEWE